MSERMAQALIGLMSLSVAMPSVAQALADPTRPPNTMETSAAESGAGTSGPVLKSILLSSNRRLAVIDGRTVNVGDRVGNARVIAIDTDSVKLRGSEGVTSLKLLPEVKRTGSKPAASRAEPRSQQRGKSR